jgi:hypothetical protein
VPAATPFIPMLETLALFGWIHALLRSPKKRAVAGGTAAVVGGGMIMAAASFDINIGGGSGPSITCDHTAANGAGLTSAISAASNGQTICLTAATSYGSFTGTNKSVTIVSQAATGPPDPVDNSMTLSLGSGDTGFTIDGGRDRWDSSEGLNIPTAAITTGASNITLTDFEIDGTGGSGRRWTFDFAPVDSNILLDHFYAHHALGGEAIFYIDDTSGSGAFDTGITIQNSLFHTVSNDGVKLTGDDTVRVLNNKFVNFHESLSGDGNHTDAIQWLEGNHVIKGNWIDDADQCFFGDDGSGNLTMTHNIALDCASWWFNIGGDDPASDVSYNTVVKSTGFSIFGDMTITCGNNDPALPASLTNITNNIAHELGLGSEGGLACTPTANHHNALDTGQSTTGTGGSNFTVASITYAGGSDPGAFDSFDDFCPTAPSSVTTGATDGGDVGVCGGDYSGSNYGPPSGEGF